MPYSLSPFSDIHLDEQPLPPARQHRYHPPFLQRLWAYYRNSLQYPPTPRAFHLCVGDRLA